MGRLGFEPRTLGLRVRPRFRTEPAHTHTSYLIWAFWGRRVRGYPTYIHMYDPTKTLPRPRIVTRARS